MPLVQTTDAPSRTEVALSIQNALLPIASRAEMQGAVATCAPASDLQSTKSQVVALQIAVAGKADLGAVHSAANADALLAQSAASVRTDLSVAVARLETDIAAKADQSDLQCPTCMVS